jgi:hypothetical protein
MVPRFRPLVLDVSAMTNPDMSDVDALAGLQLLAHRLGSSIVLEQASDELLSLIEFSGLGEILLSSPLRRVSVREPNRKAEERKQVGVDEEVDPGDAIT